MTVASPFCQQSRRANQLFIISLTVGSQILYMNKVHLMVFTNLHVGRVTAESFFCEVTTSAPNSKSCLVNNLPFR